MKWTKTQDTWHLKDYPFFYSCIKQLRNGKFRYKLQEYDTLGEPKRLVIEAIRSLKPVKQYSDIIKPACFYILEDGWPNNIGEGSYIKPYYYNERYKWVEGAHQYWRNPHNSYYVRFPYNTSREVLERYCVKIHNRHLNRFKK